MQQPVDITRLEQNVKRLQKLIEVNGVISSSLNLDQILEREMAASKQIMNADASSPMLIDEKTNELVYEVALGTIGEKLKQEFRLKMGQGIAGTVAQEGKPLLLEVAYTHPKFHRAHDDATGVPDPVGKEPQGNDRRRQSTPMEAAQKTVMKQKITNDGTDEKEYAWRSRQ